jgi:hypothetical protein
LGIVAAMIETTNKKVIRVFIFHQTV